MFEQLLPKSRFVGEVGLDASPQHYASFQLQKDLFERILQMCAEQKNKILSIHAVRATREVLTLLEKHLLPNKGKAVLHWFSGTVAEAQRAAKLGCYFSINGEMLSKESRQNVVSSLPLTRILTETDGPFTKIDDQVTRPSSVSHTVSRLSRLIKMDEAILRELIATNLRQLES